MHKYRFFIMVMLLLLGLFANYFGNKNIKYTMITIGFSLSFFVSFFVFNFLFYENGKWYKVLFIILVSICIGLLGGTFINLLSEYINYVFIFCIGLTSLFFLSYIQVNFLVMCLVLILILAIFAGIHIKFPRFL